MFQNIPTKCLVKNVRLSYVNLIEPKENKNGGDPKYSVTLLVPKTDVATYSDLQKSLQAAYEKGVREKWNNARPKLIHPLIYDGDGVRNDGQAFGPEAKGHWVLTASSKTKPQVVGTADIMVGLPPQEIYSGMYAHVTINFYPFSTDGNKGVGCGLGNVLKIADGEPLSGGASAASDFGDLVGQAASDFGEPAPAFPGQQPAQPVQSTTRINPMTGLPM